MVRYIVLGLLRRGTAHHGYALLKEYRRRSGSHLIGGRLYGEIQRLVREGLVRPTTKAPGSDARRVPYEITPAGAAEFDSWLVSVGVAGGRLDDELYALVAILGEAPPPSVSAALRRWHEELCIRGAQIEQAQQATAKERSDHPTALDPLQLILDHRLRRAAADVELIEKLRDAYEKSAGLPSLPPSPSSASSGREGVDLAKLRAGAQGRHHAGCRSSRSR